MKPWQQSGRIENMSHDDWIVIEDACPAIVDRDTWERAQVMVTKRAEAKGGRGKQTNRWLLSGVLRCGDCGNGYWGERKRKGRIPGRREVITNYYTCAGRRAYGKDICRVSSHIKADALETWVLGKLKQFVFADQVGVEDAIERFVELASGERETTTDVTAIERELAEIDATVKAITASIDPANLVLLNDRLTQLRRRKEHLQRELRVAKATARGVDAKGLRKWAQERITGLADAIAGRRNEQVRRVLASYVDEIVVYPSSKTGVLRVNAALAAFVGDGAASNANDRPAGRSWAGTLAG